MVDTTCAKCRREGVKLFLKGEKCFSPKCPVMLRTYAPGQAGASLRRKKVSAFGEQLREKQKLKRIYGMRERQFRNYFKRAEATKGLTGEELLRRLELRLDNVVFRLGFATSREQARQLVSHAHFLVAGKKVNIPSYQVKKGEKITLSEQAKGSAYFKATLPNLGKTEVPSWLLLDAKKGEGEVKDLPQKEHLAQDVDEALVVEYYSR